jgi:formate hydrogenlyase subunit 6/NADH:ubiquinone oxidoreductase subunit I
MCEKACPNKCIELEISTYEVEVETPDGEKKMKTKKKVDEFNVYIGRCMFCGLCVDNCPKGALGMTTEYEFSDNDRKSLVYGIDRLPKKEMPKEEEKENEPES